MSSRRLLLFARAPVAGEVKTRLIAPDGLTADGAALLHRAFVGDLSHRFADGAWETVLMWALEPGEAPPADLAPDSMAWRRQEGRDLGERLYRGLAWAARDAVAVAAVGSDHPELSAARVEGAFAWLETGCDLVLGPARDGGYYLIGLRREALHRRLFEGIRWSTSSVLAATVAHADQLGLSVRQLPVEGDVDTVADLARLRAGFKAEPELRSACRRTAEVLGLAELRPPGSGAAGGLS